MTGLGLATDALTPKIPELPDAPAAPPPAPEPTARQAEVSSRIRRQRRSAARLGTSALRIPLNVNIPR